MERKIKYQHKHASRFSQVLKITLLSLIVFMAALALNQVDFSSYFPIKKVKIYGINRADHQEVKDVLLPLVSNGFFTVNVEYIRDRLLQIPWVSEISVRRAWPDQVDITLIEKKPLALWNNQSLLSEEGELFEPKQETYPSHLPQLIGPSGQHVYMLQYFKDMNRLLLPLHARISSLELTPYFTWKLTLDNGIIMQVGHKDILTRLSHFVKVYPKIVGVHAADVDYIDLRYPNGAAVRWKASMST